MKRTNDWILQICVKLNKLRFNQSRTIWVFLKLILFIFSFWNFNNLSLSHKYTHDFPVSIREDSATRGDPRFSKGSSLSDGQH